MVLLFLAVVLWGADVAPATASVSPPEAGEITRPQWVATPDGMVLARLYPPDALRQGLGGRGTVSCRVTAKGRLKSCTVVEEQGAGFGKAVLEASYYFRMAPVDRDGVSVEGRTVRIPLVWRHPNEPRP